MAIYTRALEIIRTTRLRSSLNNQPHRGRLLRRKVYNVGAAASPWEVFMSSFTIEPA